MKRNKLRAAALVGACVLALTACGDSGDKLAPVSARSSMGLTIYPSYDATGVKPDSTVTVNGTYGRLDEVQVFDSEGTVIGGAFSGDRSAWVADRRLAPNEQYTVIARGTSENGAAVSQTSRFSTLEVKEKDQTGSTLISPPDGSTVGIAQPVVVAFNHNIINREAALQALTIETSEEVEGGWYWIDAREVHWRPKEYWPTGTKVTVTENLVG